jgi:tetratricopeptide (TPR) repeat protein
MLMEIIKFLAKNKQTALALESLAAMEEKTSNVCDLRDLACIYSSIDEHEKAIELAEKCKSIVSDYDERNRIMVILARIYLDAGQPRKSLEAFSQVPTMFQIESLKNEIFESIRLNENISETGFWKGDLVKEHENFHCIELSDWIANYLDKEKQLTDFGCGSGYYLKYFKSKGFTNILGYEGQQSNHFVFDKIKIQDLTQPFMVESQGNVLSLEVGEHIPKKYQNVFIENICNACDDILILSWATRGQKGVNHVNCLNNEEAISLIESKGFNLQEEATRSARDSIKDHCLWFKNTLMIFKKNG